MDVFFPTKVKSGSFRSLGPSLGSENTLVVTRVGKRSKNAREEEKYFVSFGRFQSVTVTPANPG